MGKSIMTRMGYRWLGVLSVLASAVACTTSKPQQNSKEPVAVSKGVAAQGTNSGSGKQGQVATVSGTKGELVGPPAPVRDPNCVVLAKMPHEPPVYAPAQGVVVTRIMESCVAMDGRRGFTKKTPWLAMGFPCTGGSGRIDIKGNYMNPKLVSFVIGTDCVMAPQGQDQVKRIAIATFDLPSESRLMAYTPFVVQYWEVPGMTDADTGYAVELRSAPALEGIWKRVRDNQVFRVRLFGRENTWAPGGHFYQVEADVRLTGRNAFQLTVASVKHLSSDELQAVKRRCEALRPERNCGAVF
jgi:hypothetical protein